MYVKSYMILQEIFIHFYNFKIGNDKISKISDVLDLGCGIGNSTLALVSEFEDAKFVFYFKF